MKLIKNKILVLEIILRFRKSRITSIISKFVLIKINLLLLSHFLLTKNLKVVSRKYNFSVNGRINYCLKNNSRENYINKYKKIKMTHPHQKYLPFICFGKLSSSAYFLIIILLFRQTLRSKVQNWTAPKT